MNARVKAVVALGLAFACDGWASLRERLRAEPGDAEFYVLVQQWLPEACSRTGSASRACASPRPAWRDGLVLHTLQAHAPGHFVREECDDTPLRREDLPEATWSSLSAHAPEVIDGVSWVEAYGFGLVGTAVVLLWAAFYLAVNIQRRSTRDVEQRVMDPIPLVSFCYYVINMILDILCLVAVQILQRALSRTEAWGPTLWRVFYINLISLLDSVVMVVVHVPKVQEILSMYVFESWHPWTMGALFFIRYVTISLLIEPVSECDAGGQESEISKALHFGPLLSYEFRRGSALVICNSRYSAGSGSEPLQNREDAFRYASALESIGFKVSGLYFDLSAAEMMFRVREWAESDEAKQADAFAFAYSGHGEVETLVGVDGDKAKFPQLMGTCLCREALVPRLFFFDCCRGRSVESRRPRRNLLRCKFKVKLGCNPRGPSAMKDCLACYATARYFPAYGEAEGEFASSLCEHIQRLAQDKDGEHDIEEALKAAGAEVALKSLGLCKRQCPTYESTLTRRFVLRRARAAGRSSSSLTVTTASGADLGSAHAAGTSSATLLSEA